MGGAFDIRTCPPDLPPTYAQYTRSLTDTVSKVRNDSRTKAVYAKAGFRRFDKFTRTGGVRSTWDHVLQTNTVLDPTTLAITSTRDGPGTAIGDASRQSIGHTLGARYRFTSRTLFYFNDSKGHSSGALRDVAHAERYDPDTLSNFGSGIKSTVDLTPEWSTRLNRSRYHGLFVRRKRRFLWAR